MKVYKIYKITNLINNKVYIGQTYRSVKKRFREHKNGDDRYKRKRPLQLAMEKHGAENFQLEVLEECYTEYTALETESFFIRKHNSTNEKFGYNLVEESVGGRIFSDSTKKKMRVARLKSYNSFSEEKKTKIKTKLRNHFQGLNKNKKSGFIGVVVTKVTRCFNIRNKMWKDVKRHSFLNPVKAAICYDKLILFTMGENAKFNFPQKIEKWKNQDLKKFYELMCKRRSTLNKKEKFIYFSKKYNRWIVCFYKGYKKIKSKVFRDIEAAKTWRNENMNLYT